jgi:WD40 repeat protein
VWTVPGGREDLVLHGHIGRVTSVALSPNGRTLVSGDANGEAKFWDTRTGLELMGLRRHVGPITAIEFSENGKLVVTAGSQIGVWETATD